MKPDPVLSSQYKLSYSRHAIKNVVPNEVASECRLISACLDEGTASMMKTKIPTTKNGFRFFNSIKKDQNLELGIHFLMSNKIKRQLGTKSIKETQSSLQREPRTVGEEERSTLSDGGRQC